MISRKYIVSVSILLISLYGCSFIKFTRTSAINDIRNQEKIFIKKIDFYECGNKDRIFRGYAKYYRDSVFILTLISNQGINAGRVYLWNNEILIINRIHKLYYKENSVKDPIKYIDKYLKDKERRQRKISIRLGNDNVIDIWNERLNEKGDQTFTIRESYQNQCIKIKISEISIPEGKFNVLLRENLEKGYTEVNDINEVLN